MISEAQVSLLVDSINYHGRTAYGEQKLESWEHFGPFVQRFSSQWGNFIYRGQARSDWELDSSFDRIPPDTLEAEKANLAANRDKRLKDHLIRFVCESCGRRGTNPSKLESEDEWWSLGQHHGLKTPLLDWTESPFIGLFFAFFHSNDRESTEYRTVYALSEKALDRRDRYWSAMLTAGNDQVREVMRRIAAREQEGKVTVVRTLLDENVRMRAQRGLSTKSESAYSVDAWVKSKFAVMTDGPVLLKVLIRNDGREQCLAYLNQMNISSSSLFPDLHGTSEYCNMARDIAGYSQLESPSEE